MRESARPGMSLHERLMSHEHERYQVQQMPASLYIAR
jgi:hypothetical protein